MALVFFNFVQIVQFFVSRHEWKVSILFLTFFCWLVKMHSFKKVSKDFFYSATFQLLECLEPSLGSSWIMLKWVLSFSQYKTVVVPTFFATAFLYFLFHSVKRWRSFVILPRQTICLGPNCELWEEEWVCSKVSSWCL